MPIVGGGGVDALGSPASSKALTLKMPLDHPVGLSHSSINFEFMTAQQTILKPGKTTTWNHHTKDPDLGGISRSSSVWRKPNWCISLILPSPVCNGE